MTEDLFVIAKHADHFVANASRREVQSANLQNARASGGSQRQQDAEVEVVREEDVLRVPRPGEQDEIRRPRIPDVAPVNGLEPVPDEKRRPQRRQVHVHEYLQDAFSGSSTSSVRQAA